MNKPWVHIYCCPECDHMFTVDHHDDDAYADPCPECSYSLPDLVDLFREGYPRDE